ncbi:MULTISPECIES: AMP-binding protein [Desulfococcus]|uniref:AMP-dependent synthetase and ligase n=1 Tax=Desulfococcus multivorans DSM 2059 TaxID=1121405 RepID=S7TZH6_DESML|nr:AMP-binding protein [Desulfococcus multivorans]AOY58339.1 long-chain fatty acid CoA-ligase [Desulfococcus multivorans]AQV00670.1 AMP-dependent synthetase [Desulfococcus multivorans]EPR42586.1 AMP-dependent synthetase and ligase [Desulfococcus multivorans DSM 2059]SKA18248.1 long-chain acyl-CoA synthetase [Desulfococcus multivorans DSM 2059]
MRSFSIYDMYRRNAHLYRDRTAVVSGGLRRDFQTLLRDAEAFAAALADAGVEKGDRVAILAMNDHRFFTLFGAASALGAIVVPLNWRLSDDEIAFILSDAGPRMLISDGNFADRAEALGEKAGGMTTVFWNSTDSRRPDMDQMAADAVRADFKAPGPVHGDDPFCIIYTAAVDGRPRGAVLSHSNIIYGNLQTSATMGLTAEDAYLNMLPMFHITGLNLSMSVMHVGGKNVVIEKFDEHRSLAETEREQVSVWGSFPPMLTRLTQAADKGERNLSSLRHVMGIDGPDNIRPFEARIGAVFWILYGQTETSGLVTFSPAMERPGAAGRVGLLTKVRIADDADGDVPPGEVGEILVQGPLVFQGFWNQPELTERTFRGGWHHTGDIGCFDEDGFLWFKGRKPEKELIKPGGENVYPAEVEAVVLEHPDIVEASVIGVPDPQFGEGIKAVCVRKPGSVLTAEELIAFVAGRIARYKKPRYVDFVEALPRKKDGGIDREAVKATHGA